MPVDAWLFELYTYLYINPLGLLLTGLHPVRSNNSHSYECTVDAWLFELYTYFVH